MLAPPPPYTDHTTQSPCFAHTAKPHRMILDDQSCVERARSCTVLFHFDALCANCPHHAAEGRDDCPYHRTCRGPRHYLLHATPNLRSQRLHWMSQRNFAAKSLSRPDVQVLLTMAPPGFDAQTCDGNGWALIHHAVSTTQAPGESGPSFLRWLIDRPENGVDLAQLTAGIALDRASFPFYGPRMLGDHNTQGRSAPQVALQHLNWFVLDFLLKGYEAARISISGHQNSFWVEVEDFIDQGSDDRQVMPFYAATAILFAAEPPPWSSLLGQFPVLAEQGRRLRLVWPTLRQDQANSLAASDWGQAVPSVLRDAVEHLAAFSWADACVLAAVNLLPASRNELNLSTHETIDQFFTPTATASLFADQTRFNIIDGSHRVPAYAPSTTTPGARPIHDHLPILDATDQSLFSLPHYVPTRQRENRP
jgi:hypothetical protein